MSEPATRPFALLMRRAVAPWARNARARWWLRRWMSVRARVGTARRGTLVYVGMHKGREFDVMFRDYETCYGFEANADLYAILVEKYRDQPQVRLFNRAVGTRAGPVSFNISSNAGASSSMGVFDERWNHAQSGDIRMERRITVEGIHLGDFLRAQGVDRIAHYVSDIQGMDLAALQTLGPWIDAKKIGAITVETTREDKGNIYKDLPSNAESGFLALLGDNYRLVAMGYGVLADYWFEDIPAETWEVDCKWRVK